MKDRLTRSFYARDTHDVAKDLLGKLLVRSFDSHQIIGRITEVESYVGENDRACHASKGKTTRNQIMFGKAGHAYVYLIYGMYHCFNIVTDKEHVPAAVLIRSLEPIDGIAHMQQYRNTDAIHNLTTGPGKLCQALSIDKTYNGADITQDSRLSIVDDKYPSQQHHITTSTRIGVDYAGKDALLPWRYYLSNSQFVSKR